MWLSGWNRFGWWKLSRPTKEVADRLATRLMSIGNQYVQVTHYEPVIPVNQEAHLEK